MESDIGEVLTRCTARLVVACYAIQLIFAANGSKTRWTQQASLRLATAAYVALVAHVVCAFQFYHGWNHTAAYEHTARQTAAVVGLDWGGGLYFNYLFLVAWGSDVAARWRMGDAYIKRHRVCWSVQAVVAFMLFNATIVFGPPFWKWTAAAFGIVILSIRLVRRGRAPD